MQHSVKEVCEKIEQERAHFSADTSSELSRYLPAKGDLVYGKYEDDNWYRCVVTNCNQSRNKYELFYFDFGNTELASSEDILQGWTNEHMRLFTEHPMLAFKCRLYGLKSLTGESFTDQENAAFKKKAGDKGYNVKFVKFNREKDIFEICMREKDQTDWFQFHHMLISMKIGKIILNYIDFNFELGAD